MLTFSNINIKPGTLSINRGIASPSYFECSFEVNKTIADLKNINFHLNWCAWVAAGYTPGSFSPSDSNYGIEMGSNTAWITPGTWYLLDFGGSASSYFGRSEIKFTAAGLNTIIGLRVYFINRFDIQGAYKTQTYSNHDKLLKDQYNSTTELNNTASFSDVYSTEKYFKAFFLSYEKTSGDITRFEIPIKNKLRFYNLDVLGNPSPIVNPTVSLERNSQPVFDLASNEDTLVRIKINEGSLPPGWTTGLKVYLMLIKTSTLDNTVTMESNYSLRYIEALSFTADLDPKYALGTGDIWIAPNTGLTPLGGGDYEITATLEHSRLDKNVKYRIIHIWRINNAALPAEDYPVLGTNIHDFPFISAQFECNDHTPVLPINGVTIDENELCDYLNCYGSSLKATIGERLLSKVKLRFRDYNNDSTREKTMNVGISNVRTFIWSAVAGDPLFYKDVYTDKLSTRNGSTWSNPDGVEVFTNGSDLYIRHNFRLRYDENENALYTVLEQDLNTKIPTTANCNWENKTIFLTYIVSINNKDANTGEDFIDEIWVQQKVYVKGFDPDGTEGELKAEIQDGAKFFCDNGDDYTVCFEKSMYSPAAKFLAIVDKYPYNSGYAGEEESYSSTNLKTSTANEIYDVDEDFVSDVACLKVSLKDLNVNKKYRILGIKKSLI